jgi:ketosteroid isomerase-like protein
MHKNAEIVRRGYQAFNAADIKTLTELFDEKASWHTPGRSTIAGDHVGREAAFTQFGRYLQETGGTFKAELRHVLADDDGRVVGVHHNSAMRRGKRLDVDCCIVFQIENGRVTDGREYFFDLQAWDEFWS